MLTKVCENCGLEFSIKSYRKDVAKFCSHDCYGLSIRGKIPKSAFKRGQRSSPNTEFKPGKDHVYFGKSGPAKNKHWKLSIITRQKMSFRQLGKPKPNLQKENHWNWRGGTTPENLRIRQSLEYKIWRKAVFERDGYACVLCGCGKSGSLNADHIQPFAFYPELRFELSNGRTLCFECHKKTDTFGVKVKKHKPK